MALAVPLGRRVRGHADQPPHDRCVVASASLAAGGRISTLAAGWGARRRNDQAIPIVTSMNVSDTVFVIITGALPIEIP